MDEEKKRSFDDISRTTDAQRAAARDAQRIPGSMDRRAVSDRPVYQPGPIDVSGFGLGTAAAQRSHEAAAFVRKYAGTVQELSAALRDSEKDAQKRSAELPGNDKGAQKSPADAEKFEAFRDAADRAAEALTKKDPDRAEIDKSMKELFEAAKAYDEHCTSEKRLDPASASPNELERWKTAKEVTLLADIYSGKKPVEKVSLKALGRETGIVSTGYELARDAKDAAEEKAQKLLHGTPEEREAVSDQLSEFLDKKEHRKLDPNRLGSMSPAEQFEYLRQPENRAALESMLILAAHAEDAANSLTRSGRKLTVTQVSDMQKKSRHMAAFADGMMFAMDPKQYEADRVNSTPELREFKTLGTRLKTAMTALDGVEAKKVAGLTMDRRREVKPMEDPTVQPPSKKAPQRGGPSM